MTKIVKYKKVNSSGKTFVVGDIHGCYYLLIEELSKIKFDFDKDLLIGTGDLIDRGQHSLDSLKLLYKKWFVTVKGNHEEMAINAVLGEGDYEYCWRSNGGNWYHNLTDFERNECKILLKIAQELPLVIETTVNNKKIVICHADYPSNNYEFDKQLSYDDIIWSRSRYNKREYCVNEIMGADLFIFGHTPVAEIIHYENQMYIDTGAVFKNGKLTIIEL